MSPITKFQVLSQLPAHADNKRDVTLFYGSGTANVVKRIQVGRPTYFDEIIVIKSRLEGQWPSGPIQPPRSLKQLVKWSWQTSHRTAMNRLPPMEIEGPLLDMRKLEPNNVAHLLLEILPYCLYVQNIVGEQRIKVLFNRMVEPFLSVLAKFNISPIFAHRPVSGEFVRVLGSRGLSFYDLPGTFDCDGCMFFREIYLPFSSQPPAVAEKVFVARRGARALTNHQEVEDFLAARGYTTVYFEDYSIAQQMSLGANATSVVSIHGAAMSWFLLGTRLDSMIELLPPHVYHSLFAVCLPYSIADYKLVIQQFNPDISYQGWAAISQQKNAPFAANMSLLEESVRTP